MATAQRENTLILKIGKHKKDDIDDLRDGEGRIFKKIEYVLEKLQASGQLSENYQPIIVITKKKNEKDW
ncbi:MAG: DUF3713 domain-containing protein [Symploca sp. SIO2E6]|nr:DUF3713 domain-containing protein [Symploca sp. SIO2E6]